MKRKLVERFRVVPGSKVDLGRFPTDWGGPREAEPGGQDATKARAAEQLERSRQELAEAQELLYASDVHSVLIVFQAMDAAGKDGTIRHVMSGVNPQGCQVFSFKRPSDEELDHDFLWRYAKCLPERGRIGIFNRSYYEEVLVVRVHPGILASQKLPPGKRDGSFWKQRFDDINAFERHLVRNGTILVKFFLHLSKAEQKRRFLERLDDPEKHWKFAAADLDARSYWKDYMRAYEKMLQATSTEAAPWYVIPADRKYAARALAADIIITAIRDLKLKFPEVGKEKLAELAAARRRLESE